MSDETNQADTIVTKNNLTEVNGHSNGTVIHENGSHSPKKSLKVKVNAENKDDLISNGNGHSVTKNVDTVYETLSNIDSYPSSTVETPTVSSSDEPNHKHETMKNQPENGHEKSSIADSGVLSDTNNGSHSGTDTEKTSFNDDLNLSSSQSSSIMSAARLLETNVVETAPPMRSTSPTSGVIIPEEKRVTDRVKVFEAAANNEQSSLKKQNGKNSNQKKSSTSSSFTSADLKSNGKREQVSPVSTSDSVETLTPSVPNEQKSSTGKSKSKRPSLKKQIQNLLKIDKSAASEESPIIEEQTSMTNGKKANTLNAANRQKKDNGIRNACC